MKYLNWVPSTHRFVKNQIKYFWQKRQKREKLILGLGFVFVVITGFYLGLWVPYRNYQSNLLTRYVAFQKDIPFIARTLQSYEAIKNNNAIPKPNTSEPLTSQVSQMLVSQQLVPFGIKTKTLNAHTEQLTFKQAPFDMLMTGIESLSRQAIFVEKAAIQRVNNKGIVKGSLLLVQLVPNKN